MAFHLAEVVFLRELHQLAPVKTGKVAARATDLVLARGLRSIERQIAERTPPEAR